MLNVFAAALSVVAGVGWVGWRTRTGQDRAVRELVEARSDAGSNLVVYTRAGRRGLKDAGGNFVPLGTYSRIASSSPVADNLLYALAEPSRVIARSEHGAESSAFRYRYAYKETSTIAGSDDVETILAVEPDLVFVHGGSPKNRYARIREAGVYVFDLGSMLGVDALVEDILQMSALLGRPERGRVLADRFRRRLARVAQNVAVGARPTALYLSVYGGKIYGGTVGSSYHDLLHFSGLNDLAAERFRGWPRFSPEDLWVMNPDVVVTQKGMGVVLCGLTGLAELRACAEKAPSEQEGALWGIVELEPALLSLPSLDMLEAVEAIYESVHGER